MKSSLTRAANPRHARQGDGQRALFLTYNKPLTAQLRRIVALRQIERGQGDHLPEGPDTETHSLPAGTNASDYDHFSWFMAVSRARQ